MYKVFSAIIFSTLILMAACSGKPEVAKSNTEIDHNKMDHSKMDHSKMTSSQNAASVPYDLQFLDSMIAHHEGALQMASPVRSQAEHQEIKTLGENILSSQDGEIKQMKAWRDKWFPGAAPAINMEMAGMADSMKDMDMIALTSKKGNAFDLEFIRQMTPHHKGAVVMGEEALQKSSRDEIKKLAREIINAQQAEIDQMALWKTAWSK